MCMCEGLCIHKSLVSIYYGVLLEVYDSSEIGKRGDGRVEQGWDKRSK